MKTACCFLLCLTMIAAANAQQAEFTIPEEIEVVPGRLAVVFADGVSEAEARAWLGDLGYAVDRVNFGYVVVAIRAQEPFPPRVVDAVRALAEVVAVDTGVAPRYGSGGIGVPAGYRLVAELHPHLSAARARQLVGDAAGMETDEVHKVPNDIEIQVPEGEEAMEVDALQQHPIVQYVTYVARPGGL